MHKQIIMKARKEQKLLKFSPEITNKSKELVKKAYAPIYTNRRLQHISFIKKFNITRLRLALKSNEQSIVEAIPIPKKLKKQYLCFNPDSVKPLFNRQKTPMKLYVTTEDRELKTNCTFQPNITKYNITSKLDYTSTEDMNAQTKLIEENLRTAREGGLTVGDLKRMLKSDRVMQPGFDSVLHKYI